MRLTFLQSVTPLAQELHSPAGTLRFWGGSNLAWPRALEILASGQFPCQIRGNFAFVWEGQHETIAAVDHLASRPLFFTDSHISHIFFDLKQTVPDARRNRTVDFEIEFLGGQSFSGDDTTYREIRRILPGHYLRDGKQTPYIDFYGYEGDQILDVDFFRDLVESRIRSLVKDENALLLSGGTDSVTLAGIARKLGLQDRFSFVHAHSHAQSFTEAHLVSQIAHEMQLPVTHAQIPLSGDILPEQSGRQFSFWVENPFSAKRLAVEAAGAAGKRIFTGELGDQLFGGPKNPALLNYALQSDRISADEIAMLWINLSFSYGRNHSLRPHGKIVELCGREPEAKEAYGRLTGSIAALFHRIETKDFLNRIMLMNYLIKGPYRAWAYSQDELDWVHPFADWSLFDYSFRLGSDQKIGGGGKQKWAFLRAWRPFISEKPWSVAKHGFGIPAKSKLRVEA